jgi:hypothetical protein
VLDLETLIRYIGPKDSDICREVAVALALVESDLECVNSVACFSDVEKLARVAEDIRSEAKRKGITYTIPRLTRTGNQDSAREEKTEEILRRIQYNALGYIVEAVRHACAERARLTFRESIGLKEGEEIWESLPSEKR